MATLQELEAHFLKVLDDRTYETAGISLANADGVMFLCPKCFAANGGKVGTHSVICWFRGKVSDELTPKPGRWTPVGTGLGDLTFVPGNPPMAISVLLTSGCGWHGFVKDGRAE